jgi:sulfur carrier protein
VIRVNGESLPYVAQSVAELVRRLDIEPRGVAVAIDGDVVRRSEWEHVLIADGNVIEIVTAVAGG